MTFRAWAPFFIVLLAGHFIFSAAYPGSATRRTSPQEGWHCGMKLCQCKDHHHAEQAAQTGQNLIEELLKDIQFEGKRIFTNPADSSSSGHLAFNAKTSYLEQKASLKPVQDDQPAFEANFNHPQLPLLDQRLDKPPALHTSFPTF